MPDGGSRQRWEVDALKLSYDEEFERKFLAQRTPSS